MGVTIYDIAERASVSIATVSRVLNGSNRVSETTRAHVRRVADDLGYRPHTSARSLARRSTNVIAAVVPMLSNLFFGELLRGLQDRVSESEYDLVVFAARTMDEIDGQLERALQRGRSAGTLLFSSPVDELKSDMLREGRQPIVLVDSIHDGFDAVGSNNIHGGELAVRHLLECGAQRIGMLMANPESVPAADRRVGFERGLVSAGIPLDESLIDVVTEGLHHGYTEQAGYEGMQRLLTLASRPDAVFVTSDLQALGALQAIREAGLRVPRDMRVVGYDDIVVSRHIGLTTVRQPMYEIGSLAGEHLLARIENPDRPLAQTVLSPRLVVRCTSSDERPVAAVRQAVTL